MLKISHHALTQAELRYPKILSGMSRKQQHNFIKMAAFGSFVIKINDDGSKERLGRGMRFIERDNTIVTTVHNRKI